MRSAFRVFLSFFLLLTGVEICAGQDSASWNKAEFKQFFYEDGKISSEGYFVDGQPEGVWKNYDRHGNLISHGARKNLKLFGLWTFYQNGKKVSEICYENDRKNGPSVYYLSDRVVFENFVNDTLQGIRRITDTTGKILRTVIFKNGLENGFEKRYNAYGDVSLFTFFVNGKIMFREAVNSRDRWGKQQGVWKAFYENGMLHWECTYRDGMKDGYYKEYDSTGSLLTLQKYVMDVLQEDAPEIAEMTVHTEYYANGSPKFRVTYRNGKPEGICREYDSITGKVVRGIVFKDGVAVGSGAVDNEGNLQNDWKEYYPDGKIRCTGVYYKGRKHGRWKYFYPDGKLEQEGEYRNGEYDGHWTWYYPNGKLRMVQEYYRGKLDGESVEYDDSARVLAKGRYEEGLEEGRWTYFRNGEFMEGSFRMGERDGIWKTYWNINGKKGKLSFQGRYTGGMPDGQHRYFNEEGVLEEEGYYRLGKRIGTWIRYDSDGQPSVRVRYDEIEEEIRYNGKRTLTKEEETENR